MDSPGFVLVSFAAAAAFTIFYLIKSRHIEQLAKIEHGLVEEEPKEKSSLILNLGIFFVSLGLGLFISYLVSYLTLIPNYISIPGFLLVFGGIGLIISVLINNKKKG